MRLSSWSFTREVWWMWVLNGALVVAGLCAVLLPLVARSCAR